MRSPRGSAGSGSRARELWYDSGWSANERKKPTMTAHGVRRASRGRRGDRTPASASVAEGHARATASRARERPAQALGSAALWCRGRRPAAGAGAGCRGRSSGAGVGSASGASGLGRRAVRAPWSAPCWRRGWSNRRPSTATRSGRRGRAANRVPWGLSPGSLRAPCSWAGLSHPLRLPLSFGTRVANLTRVTSTARACSRSSNATGRRTSTTVPRCTSPSTARCCSTSPSASRGPVGRSAPTTSCSGTPRASRSPPWPCSTSGSGACSSSTTRSPSTSTAGVTARSAAPSATS